MYKSNKRVKLSIIVPCYNVEKYLKRFLYSLERNLHSNMEVIFVNDGSTDNSSYILEEFIESFQNYARLINKNNGGVSSARNVGIRECIGEYVLFVDPDDELALGCISNVIDEIYSCVDVDCFFYNYYIHSGIEVSEKVVFDSNKKCVPSVVCREFANETNVGNALWNKVFKKAVFKDIFFDEKLAYGEDVLFITNVISKCKKMRYLNKALYHYYKDNSNTLSKHVDYYNYAKWFDVAYFRYEFFSNYLDNISMNPIVKAAIEIVRRITFGEYKESTVDYTKFIKNNIKTILLDGSISIRTKKHAILIYFDLFEFYNATLHA